MVMPPETKYALSGDVSVAYQVVGDGPLDLIFVPGFVSNLELWWGQSLVAGFYERLASYTRLILLDKRGTGLSDRVAIATLEERMDDVRAVMDAVGSKQAAILGASEGGPMAILFAATYPDRSSALVIYGGYAKNYQFVSPGEWSAYVESEQREWGSEARARRSLNVGAPSMVADEKYLQWWTRFLRLSASPGAAIALARMNLEIDVRDVLPSIHVPTLIIHRSGDLDVPAQEGRYLAEHIPNAKYVEVDGVDHHPWTGESDAILDEIEEFLTGIRDPLERNRVLATVMFTDIVESTQHALELGDRKWRELLEQHHNLVRKNLARFRGKEIDTAGDGFLATFDGPARAIRCALAINAEVRKLGIEIRAGLHTGECEIIGEKVGGIAVHIGARVLSKANASQVAVSSTVKDLVAGSGIQFQDFGTHALKGIPGEWHLYQVMK